jgi:uncharacterized protein YbjQ (UPF0145 family)
MADDMLMMTTPIPDGYEIVKVFGIITGLTTRTRGVGGQFIAGIESLTGGEVTAYNSEIEKARAEAIARLKAKAVELGANAIAGIDMETSSMGTSSSMIVISATGTAMSVKKQ